MTEPQIGVGDEVAAVIEWLVADPDLAEATDAGDRIFGWELPASEAGSMPRPAIVVSDAGGFTEGLPEVLDRSRLDIRSYGRTLDEAKRVAVLVRIRLAALHRFTGTNGTVVHGGRPAGGYIPLHERAGGWPLVLRSYFILHDITPAAV
jgi:hypothetical protein